MNFEKQKSKRKRGNEVQKAAKRKRDLNFEIFFFNSPISRLVLQTRTRMIYLKSPGEEKKEEEK